MEIASPYSVTVRDAGGAVRRSPIDTNRNTPPNGTSGTSPERRRYVRSRSGSPLSVVYRGRVSTGGCTARYAHFSPTGNHATPDVHPTSTPDAPRPCDSRLGEREVSARAPRWRSITSVHAPRHDDLVAVEIWSVSVDPRLTRPPLKPSPPGNHFWSPSLTAIVLAHGAASKACL